MELRAHHSSVSIRSSFRPSIHLLSVLRSSTSKAISNRGAFALSFETKSYFPEKKRIIMSSVEIPLVFKGLSDIKSYVASVLTQHEQHGNVDSENDNYDGNRKKVKSSSAKKGRRVLSAGTLAGTVSISEAQYDAMKRTSKARRIASLEERVVETKTTGEKLDRKLKHARVDALGYGFVPLSPGEEERLKREEMKRRRRMRIIQVREQDKINAARRREAYRRQKELEKLKEIQKLKTSWEGKHSEKVGRATKAFKKTLVSIGNAHRNAMQVAETKHVNVQRSKELASALRSIEVMRERSALGRAKRELKATAHHVRLKHGKHREKVRSRMSSDQRSQAKRFQTRENQKASSAKMEEREQRLKDAERDLVMFISGRVENSGPTVGDCQEETYKATILRHGPPGKSTTAKDGFAGAKTESRLLKAKREADEAAHEHGKLAAFARGKKAGEKVAMEKLQRQMEGKLERLAKADRAEKSKAMGIKAMEREEAAKKAAAEKRHEAELEREFQKMFLVSNTAEFVQEVAPEHHDTDQRHPENDDDSEGGSGAKRARRPPRRQWQEDEILAAEDVDRYLGDLRSGMEAEDRGLDAPAERTAPSDLAASFPVGTEAPFVDEESRALLEESRAARKAAQERVAMLLSEDEQSRRGMAAAQEIFQETQSASLSDNGDSSLAMPRGEERAPVLAVASQATSSSSRAASASSPAKEIYEAEERVIAAHEALVTSSDSAKDSNESLTASERAAQLKAGSEQREDGTGTSAVSSHLEQSLDQYLSVQDDRGFVSVSVGPSEVVLDHPEDSSSRGVSVTIQADGVRQTAQSYAGDISARFGPASFEVREDSSYATSAAIVDEAMRSVLSRHSQSGFLSFDSSAAAVQSRVPPPFLNSDQSTVPSIGGGTSDGSTASPGERGYGESRFSSPSTEDEPLVQGSLDETGTDVSQQYRESFAELKSRVHHAMQMAGEGAERVASQVAGNISPPATSLFAQDDGWKASPAFAALAERVEAAIAGSSRAPEVTLGSIFHAETPSSASAPEAKSAGETEQDPEFESQSTLEDKRDPARLPVEEPSDFSVDASMATSMEATDVSEISAGPDFEDLEQKLKGALEALANFGTRSPSHVASSSVEEPAAKQELRTISPVAATLVNVKSMLEEARSELVGSVRLMDASVEISSDATRAAESAASRSVARTAVESDSPVATALENARSIISGAASELASRSLEKHEIVEPGVREEEEAADQDVGALEVAAGAPTQTIAADANDLIAPIRDEAAQEVPASAVSVSAEVRREASATRGNEPLEMFAEEPSLSLSREGKAADAESLDANTPVKVAREASPETAEDTREGTDDTNIWFEIGRGSAAGAAADDSPLNISEKQGRERQAQALRPAPVETSVDASNETLDFETSNVSFVSPVASTLVEVKKMLAEAKSTLASAEDRIDESFSAASAGSISPSRTGERSMQLHPTSFISDVSTQSPSSQSKRSAVVSSPGKASASFAGVFDNDELETGALDDEEDFSGIPSIHMSTIDASWEKASLEVVGGAANAERQRSEPASLSPAAFTIEVSGATEDLRARKRAMLARLSASRAREVKNRHSRIAVAEQYQKELEKDSARMEQIALERSRRPYGHRHEPEWKATGSASLAVSISPPPTDDEIRGSRRQRPRKPDLQLGRKKQSPKRLSKGKGRVPKSRKPGTHVHLSRTGSVEIDIVPEPPSDAAASEELMSRLASGQRTHLSRAEAVSRTRRLYNRLPEVQEKNQEAAKRRESEMRRQKAKEYAEERRRRLHDHR